MGYSMEFNTVPPDNSEIPQNASNVPSSKPIRTGQDSFAHEYRLFPVNINLAALITSLFSAMCSWINLDKTENKLNSKAVEKTKENDKSIDLSDWVLIGSNSTDASQSSQEIVINSEPKEKPAETSGGWSLLTVEEENEIPQDEHADLIKDALMIKNTLKLPVLDDSTIKTICQNPQLKKLYEEFLTAILAVSLKPETAQDSRTEEVKKLLIKSNNLMHSIGNDKSIGNRRFAASYHEHYFLQPLSKVLNVDLQSLKATIEPTPEPQAQETEDKKQ